MSVNIVKRTQVFVPGINLLPLSSNPPFNTCFATMNRIPSAFLLYSKHHIILSCLSREWQKALQEEGASLQDGKRTSTSALPHHMHRPSVTLQAQAGDHFSVGLSTQTPYTPGFEPLPSHPLAKNCRLGSDPGKLVNFSAIQQAGTTLSLTRPEPQPWGRCLHSRFVIPWILSLSPTVLFFRVLLYLMVTVYHSLVILYTKHPLLKSLYGFCFLIYA